MKKWVINISIVILILSIIGIIIWLSLKGLTTNETTLLSVLLTVISIIATWVVSNFFSFASHKATIEEVKTEYQNNLRTYALNASEKVDNLSNELTKLALYLQEELDKDEDNEEYALMSKVERLNSAIHIVNTLKSINDTSLSDWKGVIGDELEEREEEREEREEKLFELTDKIEEILETRDKTEIFDTHEIASIRRQLNQISHSINLPVKRIPRKSKKAPKDKITKPCENCEATLSYSQRTNPNSHKVVKCNVCTTRYLSRYETEKGFYLIADSKENIEFECPNCDSKLTEELSNLPYSKINCTCNECNTEIKLTRAIGGNTKASVVQNTKKRVKGQISEEILQKVIDTLPEQPWPTGIHRTVGEKLGYSNNFIFRCISNLVENGRLLPQYNGVVFVPKTEESEKSQTITVDDDGITPSS